MKKSFSIYSLTLVFLALFSSCDEDSFSTIVEVDLPEVDNILVLNSIIENDKLIQADVNFAVGILENDYDFSSIDDAEIQLFIEGDYFEDLVFETRDFIDTTYHIFGNDTIIDIYQSTLTRYFATITADPNVEYTLKASHPDYDSAEGTTKIPNPIQLISAEITDYSITISDQEKVEISLTFNDPSGESNFYSLSVGESQSGISSYHNECFSTRELIFDAASIDDFDVSGEIFLCDPFNTFSDEFFNGNTKTLRIFLSPYDVFESGNQDILKPIVFTLQSLNDDFYYYHKSANLQYLTDGDPFVEPVTVYNNIENGYGIFAGYSTSRIQF